MDEDERLKALTMLFFKTYSVDNYIPNINDRDKDALSWSDRLSDLHERMVKLEYDHETVDYDNYIFCLFLGLLRRRFVGSFNRLEPGFTSSVILQPPWLWPDNVIAQVVEAICSSSPLSSSDLKGTVRWNHEILKSRENSRPNEYSRPR